VIYPRAGMTVGGYAYPLPTVARRTSGTESGFWQTPRGIPTPSANDWKGSSKDGQRRGQLTDPAMGVIPAGGRLNPTFVEWLMGFPIGSTAFSPLEMHKFHEFMRQHGGS